VAELGYGLAEQGRNDEAIAVFEGLAALAPATAYFHSALGALKLRTGDLDSALAHLNSAIEADSTDVSALTNRGEVLILRGRSDAAARSLQDALALSDSNPPDGFAIRARALLAQLGEL